VSNVQDILSRVEGVGELQMFGSQNALRVWLNPEKLNNYRMTPSDVVAALQAQNAQVSAGQFGGSPAATGQQLNATITARTLLQTTDQFESVILRTNADGSIVVGWSTTDLGMEAFIWDNANKMRRLTDVLSAQGVTDHNGWVLSSATGVTAVGDTLVIVGKGKNPDGNTEAWRAVIANY